MAEMIHGSTPIPADIHFNVPHRFCVMARGKDGTPGVQKGSLYVPLFLAYHGITMQMLVVYAGTDGPDAGKRFCCSLADWALKFFEEPGATAAPGEVVAGHKSESLGV